MYQLGVSHLHQQYALQIQLCSGMEELQQAALEFSAAVAMRGHPALVGAHDAFVSVVDNRLLFCSFVDLVPNGEGLEASLQVGVPGISRCVHAWRDMRCRLLCMAASHEQARRPRGIKAAKLTALLSPSRAAI